MEIERKFLVRVLPENLNEFKHNEIIQGYISTSPVIRIRRSDDRYKLTVKTSGLLAREEFETDITKEQFDSLSKKVEGNIISKTRYKIPDGPYTIELDIFHNLFDGLLYAEVEFPDLEAAAKYKPPVFFGREVTNDQKYQNSSLTKMNVDDIGDFVRDCLATS